MQQKFLQEISAYLTEKHGHELEQLRIVLPNKRAGLYLRKYLSAAAKQPSWAPEIITIQDMVTQAFPLPVADPLQLNFELYRVFVKQTLTEESFDRFFPWGEMLLKDFDEIDKYLINARDIFTVIREEREIYDRFDYLTEEQKEFLSRFWRSVRTKTTGETSRFINTWSVLYPVYEQFRNELAAKNICYEGMTYREVAQHPERYFTASSEEKWFFAGFHVLTPAEERIFTWCKREKNARFFWDTDVFYMNDPRHEAGKFMREYIDRYPGELPPGNGIDTTGKQIRVLKTASRAAQCQLIGQLLAEEARIEDTAIILPDENLLEPLLHHIPEGTEKLNITMGYPLHSSLAGIFTDHWSELRKVRLLRDQKVLYNHREIVTLFSHPYIKGICPGGADILKKMASEELRFYPDWSEVTRGNLVLEAILDKYTAALPATRALRDFCVHVLTENAQAENPLSLPEKECLYALYLYLSQLEDLLQDSAIELSEEQFHKTLKRAVAQIKVPFSGEPLEGLQVMGMLETRNLDFKTVIIPDMNEGVMPSAPPSGSFIPYHLRKAFAMPDMEHHDSFNSYYFFRLLQKAENIYLVFAEDEAEPSRYITQLQYELVNVTLQHHTLSGKFRPGEVSPVTFPADGKAMVYLQNFIVNNEGNASRLSPTALKYYMDCRLKFYYRYILNITESPVVPDQPDHLFFGILSHRSLEVFYENLLADTGRNQVQPSDLEDIEAKITVAIQAAFREVYRVSEGEKLVLKGHQVLLEKAISNYMKSVLRADREYAPFVLEEQEADMEHDMEITASGRKIKVRLGGRIDRIDKKGDHIRVIDYKSGKQDITKIPSLDFLFSREADFRYKDFLQVLVYALMLGEKYPGQPIEPVLYYFRNLSASGTAVRLTFAGEDQDASPVAFREKTAGLLKGVLEELFSGKVPYDQTPHLRTCEYCTYRTVCRR